MRVWLVAFLSGVLVVMGGNDSAVSGTFAAETYQENEDKTFVEVVKPSQAFHLAYQDFSRGHFELALLQFQQFVKNFPESSLASEAYFYISECYEQQNNLKEAARALTTIVEDYPTSREVPAALFKLGKIMEQAGRPHKAKAYWHKLIQDFRGSPESKLATQRLRRMP